jgi:PBP1b-binding outer membrane lipoprotein LpoB
MKNLTLLLVIMLTIVSCKDEKSSSEEQKHNHSAETEKVEQSKKKPLSPHTETMAMIGDAHIHIDYSSPGVRNRIIFGGLVGYDQRMASRSA